MTRPNSSRADHESLKLLESLTATQEKVASVPGTPPGPVPDSTDVTWVTLEEGDPEVLVFHMAEDSGSDAVTIPMWTSFAIPDPSDPAVIVYPLLEET